MLWYEVFVLRNIGKCYLEWVGSVLESNHEWIEIVLKHYWRFGRKTKLKIFVSEWTCRRANWQSGLTESIQSRKLRFYRGKQTETVKIHRKITCE